MRIATTVGVTVLLICIIHPAEVRPQEAFEEFFDDVRESRQYFSNYSERERAELTEFLLERENARVSVEREIRILQESGAEADRVIDRTDRDIREAIQVVRQQEKEALRNAEVSRFLTFATQLVAFVEAIEAAAAAYEDHHGDGSREDLSEDYRARLQPVVRGPASEKPAEIEDVEKIIDGLAPSSADLAPLPDELTDEERSIEEGLRIINALPATYADRMAAESQFSNLEASDTIIDILTNPNQAKAFGTTIWLALRPNITGDATKYGAAYRMMLRDKLLHHARLFSIRRGIPVISEGDSISRRVERQMEELRDCENSGCMLDPKK